LDEKVQLFQPSFGTSKNPFLELPCQESTWDLTSFLVILGYKLPTQIPQAFWLHTPIKSL
jgi:hypothetical protein